MSNQPVDVTTQSFNEVMSKHDCPLALDSYQRGFVWTREKITQLIDDLSEFQKSNGNLPYYMGAILLHEDVAQGKRFIIDGQQRITALCLLYHQLHQRLPAGQQLAYSGQSARCIQEAVKAYGEGLLPDSEVLNRLVFTVIVVKNADLAFTFFDTQNNRGVPLRATDLLKAYHLRAIDHAATDKQQGESLQLECASRWEHVQQMPSVLSPGKDFAHNLFTRFLWRARRWQGQQVTPAYHDGLMEEFQSRTWGLQADRRAAVDTVPVYASRDNRLASSMSLQKGDLTLQGHKIVLSNDAAVMPMALRQPIHQGVGFFLYADKYAAILQALMNQSATDERVSFFREVYTKLLKKNQEYLREAFMVSALVYVDQFGYLNLPAFSLHLEYVLGGIRLQKQQVKRETAANFFRDGQLNLLDVIVQSYHPGQVIEYLKRIQPAYEKVYCDETIKIGTGVQGQYKKAVLSFYCTDDRAEPESLSNKLQWIMTKLEGMSHD